jgi:Skp family chaperone for outer membrane proteins
MLNKYLKFVVIVSIYLLLYSNTAKAELKIAIINFSKVINESKEAKSAKIKLDKTSLESRKIIEQLKEELSPLQEKVKEGQIKPGTPQGDEVRKKTQELVELMQTKEDELKSQYLELNKIIAEKVLKAVENYSKKNDIDLVLDQNLSTRNGVVLAESSMDITSEIIANLDR